MSQLAVLVFHEDAENKPLAFKTSEDRAKLAYEEIQRLAKDDKMAVESGTIVIKDEFGRVKIRKTSEWSVKKGAGRGAFWGLLVGLIFAGPLLGLLGGLGLGALLGGRKHQPIDRDFMKGLSEGMKPNEAALFLLVQESNAATLEELQSFDATFYTTVLTDDVKEAIDNAAKHEEVLAAVEIESDES